MTIYLVIERQYEIGTLGSDTIFHVGAYADEDEALAVVEQLEVQWADALAADPDTMTACEYYYEEVEYHGSD